MKWSKFEICSAFLRTLCHLQRERCNNILADCYMDFHGDLLDVCFHALGAHFIQTWYTRPGPGPRALCTKFVHRLYAVCIAIPQHLSMCWTILNNTCTNCDILVWDFECCTNLCELIKSFWIKWQRRYPPTLCGPNEPNGHVWANGSIYGLPQFVFLL